jgi:hypothetical protein
VSNARLYLRGAVGLVSLAWVKEGPCQAQPKHKQTKDKQLWPFWPVAQQEESQDSHQHSGNPYGRILVKDLHWSPSFQYFQPCEGLDSTLLPKKKLSP